MPRLNGKPDLSGVWRAEPTPLSEIEQAVPKFGDIQIDERVTSKYILNVFWGMKPEEEPMRVEAATRMREERPQDATSLNCLPAQVYHSSCLLRVQDPSRAVRGDDPF